MDVFIVVLYLFSSALNSAWISVSASCFSERYVEISVGLRVSSKAS